MNINPRRARTVTRSTSDSTMGNLTKLELRIRHLEATADYVQELEQRSENLEREVRALHGRVDILEKLADRRSSSSARGLERPGSGVRPAYT